MSEKIFNISVLCVTPHRSSFYDTFLNSIIEVKNLGFPIIELNLYVYEEGGRFLPKEILVINGLIINIYRGPNIGFGRANNHIAKKSKGTHLFLLNPDTKVKHIDNLEIRKLTAKNDIVGIRQEVVSKDYYFNPSVGNKVLNTFNGLTTDFFLNASLAKVNKEPLYADGAAVIINRKIYKKMGGFARNYFLFVEDVEFSIRARIMGYSIGFSEKSIIQHVSGSFIAGGAPKNSKVFLNANRRYFTQVNQVRTALRLFSVPTLLFWLPVYIFVNFIYSIAFLLIGRFDFGFVFYKAIFLNFLQIKNDLRERKKIKLHKMRGDFEFFSKIRLIPSHALVLLKYSMSGRNHTE